MDNGASSYRRYLDGEEAAFEQIVKDYFDSLIGFIDSYVHDVSAAEDIAIDTFSDLIVHKHRYNFRVSLKTYLFMIGRNSSQPTTTVIQAYSSSLPALIVEYNASYTDKETVDSIKSLIGDLTPVEDFPVSAMRIDTAHTQAMSAHESFDFVLESEEGTAESYILIENTLADCNTDTVYMLTDYQLAMLLELLAIPIE